MPKSTSSKGAAAKSSDSNGTATAKNLGAETSGLLQTLQGHVDDLRPFIQCGICIRPLYEPFTLACGHTFCYTCLTSWFSEGRSNKTCPDCRAPVVAQPAPAYLVRAIVQLFTSRAELLEKGETTAEHLKNQREEANRIDEDKKNEHPREGGLFRGAFTRPPITQPIVDLEDNVVRCPHCGWELEDDVECVQCGYNQDLASEESESDPWSGTEENSEMADYYDEEVEDDFDGPDAFFGGHRIFSAFFPSGSFGRPAESQGWRDTGVIGDSEGEDDEEDDSYDDTDMDSFIANDDQVEYESGSDPTTVVGGHDYSTQDYSTQDHGTQDYDSQMDSEAPMSQENGYASFSMDDESSEDGESETDGSDHTSDDDDDDDEDPIRPAVTGLRRHPVSGSNGNLRRGTSMRGTHGQNQRNTRSNTAGSSAHNTIDIPDDSDEEPVAPTRRTRGRTNGIY